MDLFSSIGLQEIVVVLVIALIFIGPGKIAEFGTSAGKLLKKFKKMSSALTSTLEKEMLDEKKQQEKPLSTPVRIPDEHPLIQPEEKPL